MPTDIPPAGFPPVFAFLLILIAIGVVASVIGVKEAGTIITIALGATGAALHNPRRPRQ
jgi:uncharacterized ferredoxin-like protein